MSKGRNQHVVKRTEGWAVKGEHTSKATTVVETQKQAIKIATGIAKNQNSELFIHGSDNKIRERNSYGNDTYPPKG